MNYQTADKPMILVVDDSEMNRAILSELLGAKYQIIEAKDGVQAVATLQKHSIEIALVLLDIVMPNMDGYEVLETMNREGWIKDVPVIMISAENSPVFVDRAYELGVTDFISRPFDALIVQRRAANTIMLYAKQKKLAELAAEQIYEKEKSNSLMINILSHIVEFRNGESGQHVLHVQTYTEILLRELMKLTDRYHLTNADVSLIARASALHDIGKISIPDEILNKPGRLTPEEFEIMKRHSLAGAEMLSDLMSQHADEPLVSIAYEICRWHHERFDGRGYPDGLTGDEIPISAQIVAMADVYDALTSERVYKKAFTHDKALEMIGSGQCGTFNPLLLECMEKASDQLRIVSTSEEKQEQANEEEELKSLSEIMLHTELSTTQRTITLLHSERESSAFFRTHSREIQFEYTVAPSMLALNPYAAEVLGVPELIPNPLDGWMLHSIMSPEDLRTLTSAMHKTTYTSPNAEFRFRIRFRDGEHDCSFLCQSTWSFGDQPYYTGLLGIIRIEA